MFRRTKKETFQCAPTSSEKRWHSATFRRSRSQKLQPKITNVSVFKPQRLRTFDPTSSVWHVQKIQWVRQKVGCSMGWLASVQWEHKYGHFSKEKQNEWINKHYFITWTNMQSYEPFKMSFFHSRNLTTHNWRPYNKPQLLRICKKLLVFCFVFPPRCTKQDILDTLHWKGESALDGYTDWKGGRRCHFHTLSVRQASAVVGQTIAKRHYWDGNCPFLMENCPPKKSKRIQRGVKVKDQLVKYRSGDRTWVSSTTKCISQK